MVSFRNIVLAVIIFWGTLVSADDIVEQLRNISMANINTIVIMTSQDMLTSGSYTFKGGAKMEIYNLPLYHQFKPFWRNINLFANGSIGYSKTEQDFYYGLDVPDNMNYQAIPMRFGGGIRYVNSHEFIVLGGFNIIYSHIENNYDYNTEYSREIVKPIFDDAFANQTSSSYTYEFFGRAGYYPTWKEWKPYAELTCTFFESTSKVNLKSIIEFDSSSAEVSFRVGCETPRYLHLFNTDLSNEIYLEKNSFAGDIEDTLGFEEYGAVALITHLYLYDMIPLINRLDFQLEKVNGGGIDGYSIGFGTGFSF
jgi:hypothetical protein